MTSLPILPQRSGSVLVASASPFLREQVLHSLEDSAQRVHEAHGGADALVKMESGDWQVLYLDRRLPDLDAEEVIQIIKQRFPGIEVVLLDSDGASSLSPARDDRWDRRNLEQDLGSAEPGLEMAGRVLPRKPSPMTPPTEPLPGMIGDSEAMRRVYRLARLIAPRTTTVLILGASGTGKELVARALHQLSPRAARPFVIVNCAAIPESLLESELFGYVRGAFTGAVQSHVGRVQAAAGGTLFLDEVGELPPGLQAKLLRFLEQKEVQRLGSAETVHVDVRVLAATNLDLMARAEQGAFREDLFYRLAAFPIELPSLEEHVEDIAALATHFLERLASQSRTRALILSRAALALLEAHPWRGNVRELQHVVERASILAEQDGVIGTEHLGLESGLRSRRRDVMSLA